MASSWCALLSLALLGSCAIVPEGSVPTTSLSADVASQFNFRGMPNSRRGVLQASGDIALPTKIETGVIAFKAWTNIDLSNSTGAAWFPNGHAGEPSQIDMHLSYSEHYRDFDIAFGIVSYSLQNPDDFLLAPRGERGETKEFFLSASREIPYGLVPSVTMHWDFDEAEGIYMNTGVSRAFPIEEDLVADAALSIGWSDDNQSEWSYGVQTDGIADLKLQLGISYFLDRHTTIRSSLNFSTIVDDSLSHWFDQIGVEDDNVWFMLGATWSY